MSPHRDEHLELCAGYALGNLTDVERAELEGHLKEGCGACDTEIHRLARGTWAFAAATTRMLDPPALRAKVLEAIKEEGRDRGREAKRMASKGGARAAAAPRAPIPLPRRRSAAPLIAWLFAAIAVAAAVVGYREWKTAEKLELDLSAARGEIARVNEDLRRERLWNAVATAPTVRAVALAPTRDAAAAGAAALHARVTYDPATRLAIVTVSDWMTPAGKDYQLWAVTKGGSSSLGLLRADPRGRATIHLENAGDPFTLTAFAVTQEAEGGAPTPNAPAGPVVMAGKL